MILLDYLGLRTIHSSIALFAPPEIILDDFGQNILDEKIIQEEYQPIVEIYSWKERSNKGLKEELINYFKWKRPKLTGRKVIPWSEEAKEIRQKTKVYQANLKNIYLQESILIKEAEKIVENFFDSVGIKKNTKLRVTGELVGFDIAKHSYHNRVLETNQKLSEIYSEKINIQLDSPDIRKGYGDCLLENLLYRKGSFIKKF